MKIPGSFFEIDLVINNDKLIEFRITKNKEIKYSVNPMDFSEIEYDLQSFLEDKGVFLPKNRFKLVLESLEVIYMDLTQQQQKMKERGFIKPEVTEQEEIASYQPIKPIQKVLLMGGEGKSSIYQVIFEGKLPHETNTIKPTRGIEKHEIEGYQIKVYSLAKTIADCFKFRNKIGINVTREALKIAITEKGVQPKEIMQYAEICRVDNIIKPILEAML